MKKCTTWIALCLCILLLLTACQTGRASTSKEPIPCPVKGLEWGMTVDEARTALQTAGVTEIREREYGPDTYALELTYAQAEVLGLATLDGLPLDENGHTAFSIQFFAIKDGTKRLTLVLANAKVPTEEEHLVLTKCKELVNEALTKVYGEPQESSAWGTTGKTLTAEECEGLPGELLAVAESQNFDAFYIYPTVYCFVYEMDVRMTYDATSYVWLIYGK